MTEARPLLACECVECPSHRAERERLEALVAKLTRHVFAARDAVLTEGQARILLEARVAALTAALRRFVAALDRCESNRGWFSCMDAHDGRCGYAMAGGATCACGSDELTASVEDARAALDAAAGEP
jgi:hypothetical protein